VISEQTVRLDSKATLDALITASLQILSPGWIQDPIFEVTRPNFVTAFISGKTTEEVAGLERISTIILAVSTVLKCDGDISVYDFFSKVVV